MTTLAYKDGIIACDSRTTGGDGSLIIDDETDKCYQRGDVLLFATGASDYCEQIADEYVNPTGACKIRANAFVVDGGNLYYIGSNDDQGVWKCIYDKEKYYAIGSGSQHALTAMDMGATAEEAVKMAARRDTSTGGKIRVHEVFKEMLK